MIKLAAERNLGKKTFPVISGRGKQLEYPIRCQYRDLWFECSSGRLGARNYMLMDMLGTIIIQMAFHPGPVNFENRIPTANEAEVKRMSGIYTSRNMLEQTVRRLESFEDGIIDSWIYSEEREERGKKPQMFKFTDGNLKQLPFLRKYSSREIEAHLRETSETTIRVKTSIRYYEGKDYHNLDYFSQHPSKLFRLVGVDISKRSTDGHVLEREYTVSFDTIYGYFFLQNCLSGYVDLLPSKFYMLSPFSQLYYRLLVLPFYGKAKNPISLEEIRIRLGLKTPDTYMARKVVLRILSELEANRMIANPVELKRHGGIWFSYAKCTWKEMNEGIEAR